MVKPFAKPIGLPVNTPAPETNPYSGWSFEELKCEMERIRSKNADLQKQIRNCKTAEEITELAREIDKLNYNLSKVMKVIM